MTGALISAVLVASAVFTWFAVRESSPRGLVLAIGRRAPRGVRDRYAKALDLLGFATEPEFIAGIKYGGFAGFLGFSLLVWAAGGFKAAIPFLLIALFFWVYPDKWLEQKESARIEDLRREFPLMVTLVRVYARASDLYQALGITRNALRGELKRQMDILASELTVYPMKKALENFAERCRYPLVSSFVSVVLFGITTGADVDQILDGFSRRSYEARVNEIKRKIKAQPIILSVLPAAMMFALLLLFVFPMYTNIIEKLRAF